jgi:ornithine cyclodeaminase
LTYWKTAADSALAADYLARRDAKTLLMVGAGAMAPFLIRAHQSVRPKLERTLIWNRSREKAADLAAGWGGTPGLEVVDALEEAVERADIICCATASRSPLIAGNWLKPGVHLDLVGGFTPEMREVDDEAIRRASIFVDCRDTTLDCVGDLTQPIAAGVISAGDLRADLYDLCSGRHGGRRDAAEITLFKSGGGGHLDLMTAEYLAGMLATEA